jgi:hypothetical protein
MHAPTLFIIFELLHLKIIDVHLLSPKRGEGIEISVQPMYISYPQKGVKELK